jgi:hypothetical protein
LPSKLSRPSVSRRQTPSLYSVPDGAVTAAIINTAVNRLAAE